MDTNLASQKHSEPNAAAGCPRCDVLAKCNADLLAACKAAIPFLIRLGDFIANGEGPTGMERCVTIGAIRDAIAKAEA